MENIRKFFFKILKSECENKSQNQDVQLNEVIENNNQIANQCKNTGEQKSLNEDVQINNLIKIKNIKKKFLMIKVLLPHKVRKN